MNQIKVKLLHHTPMSIAATAGRTCWNSFHKGGVYETPSKCSDVDSEFIDRVINQYHHSSIAEHISMNFFIDGISRACLQELARHRHASPSVKSSRFTLKELKNESRFDVTNQNDIVRSMKYLVFVDEGLVDASSVEALEKLRFVICQGISNDKAKYCMPEAYRTQLTWTINLRSLQNFILLRSSPKALPEIQLLAKLIYESLPSDIQGLISYDESILTKENK